jgi:hypothetical protein
MRIGGILFALNASNSAKQVTNLTKLYNFGEVTVTDNSNRVGSIIGEMIYVSGAVDLYEVNATNVYSRPDVARADNGNVLKSNQPIGWGSGPAQTLKDIILAANPTMGESAKYTLDYSKSQEFAAELGSGFQFAPNRTPKLAWEK